jgi:hypothetical protein
MHNDDLISKAGLGPVRDAAGESGAGIKGGIQEVSGRLRDVLSKLDLPGRLADVYERVLAGGAPPGRGQLAQAITCALREEGGDARSGAAGVRDILRGAAESLVDWGKSTGAFTQPEAVRIQVAEARQGVDSAFEQIPVGAGPGDALAPFADAARRFADSLGRLGLPMRRKRRWPNPRKGPPAC